MDYIAQKLCVLTTDKLKAGIFDGPEIRPLVNDEKFVETMNEIEPNTLESLALVLKHLAKHMSVKLDYLSSHLDHFSDNFGYFSDEQIDSTKKFVPWRSDIRADGFGI